MHSPLLVLLWHVWMPFQDAFRDARSLYHNAESPLARTAVLASSPLLFLYYSLLRGRKGEFNLWHIHPSDSDLERLLCCRAAVGEPRRLARLRIV